MIEKSDLQGIIVRGYGDLTSACFLVLNIVKSNEAKVWLKNNLVNITSGDMKPSESAMNIAFTHRGLNILKLQKECMDNFPMEFEDGMTAEYKQILLGDYGESDPDNWQWGGKKNEEVHLLLMLYAKDENELKNLFEKVSNDFVKYGLNLLKKLDTSNIIERKEHFGFHDGIAQPVIKGLSSLDIPGNTVAAGEFILGYKNEYDQYTESPGIDIKDDKDNILDFYKNEFEEIQNSGLKNFGKNGTYIVFRQIEQEVEKFWSYVNSKTADADGNCNINEMIKLASKFVGRWPSGVPLVDSPDEDKVNFDNTSLDKFGYNDEDKAGERCPVGSHIRRTNPRDSIDGGRKDSISIANKHRILRRGRSYGEPVTKSMKPEDIIKEKNYGGERGLYFICMNADIGRQFEFIQNFWVNNPKFEGLVNDRDPITGNHSNPDSRRTKGTFTVQDDKLRNRYHDLPEFVTVKGGAYFFLPGLKALKYLTTI